MVGDSLWIINIFLLIVLLLMAAGYTYAQQGIAHHQAGKIRFAMFGVTSFVFIGILFLGYMVFLYLSIDSGWTYPWTIGEREFDLANGFWTVLVGAATGIFLGIFALLKRQEMGGR